MKDADSESVREWRPRLRSVPDQAAGHPLAGPRRYLAAHARHHHSPHRSRCGPDETFNLAADQKDLLVHLSYELALDEYFGDPA